MALPLLAENVVHEWQAKGARLAELLDYARLRPLANASLQNQLDLRKIRLQRLSGKRWQLSI